MIDGLLAVLSEPGEVSDAQFHDWYDHEHVPLRLALDGVHSARRLQAADDVRPGWLALYDIELATLQTARYRALREQRSPREQAIVDRLAALERRVYEVVSDHGTAATPAVVVMTSFDVAPDAEQELQRWYLEEHIPMLHAIPGWSRTRRCRLLEGDAPHLLALHELTDPAALDTEQYRAATSTPWRERVMSRVVRRERRVFAMHRSF